jgi:hypothetical protein
MIRGTPIRSAVPVNRMMIRRSMAKQRGKNRPVAVPQQADHLIIQAIYRRFTGTPPSICLILRRALRAFLTMRCLRRVLARSVQAPTIAGGVT